MRRNETRVKKAMDIALERLEYIIDHKTAHRQCKIFCEMPDERNEQIGWIQIGEK